MHQGNRLGDINRMKTQNKFAVLVSGAVLLLSATSLTAHDFWLIPDSFQLRRGDTITIRAQTSSLFPTSLAAVAPDRISDARVLSAGGNEAIHDLATSDNSLLLRHRLTRVGQQVIAVRISPRSLLESPESFRRYLVLEGAPEALARYEREGKLPVDSVTRRYTKYAKTIIQVGNGGPRAFSRRAGHFLEFIPLSDPSKLKVGDRLQIQLLADGVPVEGAHITAGSISNSQAARVDTARARQASMGDSTLITDSRGAAQITISRPGIWNVRTLQIMPAVKGSGADWDVHWATLVAEVGR